MTVHDHGHNLKDLGLLLEASAAPLCSLVLISDDLLTVTVPVGWNRKVFVCWGRLFVMEDENHLFSIPADGIWPAGYSFPGY